jgi:hypothetical protein
MNRPVALVTEYLCPQGPCEGTWRGSFTGDSEGKMNFQVMGCRRFCRQVSLSVGVPLGNLVRGSVYRELRETVKGGLRKWSISLYGSSVGGTWRRKRGP